MLAHAVHETASVPGWIIPLFVAAITIWWLFWGYKSYRAGKDRTFKYPRNLR